MASEYQRTLGRRLRAIRTAQGLSLDGVEQKSLGQWKAVVVGSYERGERAISVPRLVGLTGFYGVTLADVLPPGDDAPARPGVLDEFPGEMDLCRDSCGRWVLVLSAPELQGTAVSTSQEMVLAIAEAFAAMRRDQEAVSAA
jgi:hypothetical protein